MTTKEILTPPKTIAVVGLSDKPDRISYEVASYLQNQGFTIIPVNPNILKSLERKAYPSILSIPAETPIDVVDIFRKSEDVLPIVEDVIKSGRKPIIWMQEGVISIPAQELAQMNGLQVIMDACMMKLHKSLQKR